MLRRLIVFIGAMCALLNAQTPTEVVLHNFRVPPKGGNPASTLTRDAAGNFYGTTPLRPGHGTVYKISPDGRATMIYSFKGAPGGDTPAGGVTLDPAGNMYGTTNYGGDAGFGTVYKIDPAGNETVLYSFTGNTDGSNPSGGVILDASGNLYGTAANTGQFGCGALYQLSAAGVLTVLHDFSHYACGPGSSLIRDADGNFYGTSNRPGGGTVYQVDAGNQETVLYQFVSSGGAGRTPATGVIRDADGNLYGTTLDGGAYGSGVVFKLDSTNQYTVLHNFSGADGSSPNGLIRDAAGNLYGTTKSGGTNNSGVIFKVNSPGEGIVLYEFTGGPDGGQPLAGLTGNGNGDLFGTASGGGTSGLGVVYKLDSSGQQSIIFSFPRSPDGVEPSGAMIGDGEGNLYGTTLVGGMFGWGVVFRLDAAGHETILYAFPGGSAQSPENGVVRDLAGNLYGTTRDDTDIGLAPGILFRIDATGQYSILHSFTDPASGVAPSGRLFLDSDGSIYGVAGGQPRAVLYRLDAAGNYSVLHRFLNREELVSGVIRDPAGNFYGASSNLSGGAIYKIDSSGQQTTWAALPGIPLGELYRDPAGNIYGLAEDRNGASPGWVYKAHTTGQATVFYQFTGGADGGKPTGGLIQDAAGNLYGVTGAGGTTGCGVAYELDLAGHQTVLYDFSAPYQVDGCGPQGGVIRDPSGNLYGSTNGGGLGDAGVVFKIKVE